MEKELKVGDRIPQFKAKSWDGIEIEAEDLLGSPFVLYFYAKDETPVCTTEACLFRDNMDKFDEFHTQVIGVSPDNSQTHALFVSKNNLNFLLLSDEDLSMARQFGVALPAPKKGIIRSTFIVNSDGFIKWIEKPANMENHIDRVLEEVKKIT